MKRVGPQNASRHRTSSDLIGPNLNSVRFLRPEMSAQERTRGTQRVATCRSESMFTGKKPGREHILKAISFTIVEYPGWVDARLEKP